MAYGTEEGDPAAFAANLQIGRWLIAAMQVIGGLCGIYLVGWGPVHGTSRPILLIVFGLFALSSWAGIQLARRRRGGIEASLLIQALQVLQIGTPRLLCVFVSGVSLTVDTQGGIGIFLPAQFQFFLISTSNEGVALNLIAVGSLICLLYLRKLERRPPSDPLPAPEPSAVHDWPPPPERD